MKIRKTLVVVLISVLAFCLVTWALSSAGMDEGGYLGIAAICAVGCGMAVWPMIQ